ncbi:MAG: hypothetical protein FWF08_00435 [Oscillospiraceae bacterium]|nr:hypothetical protein [Oscillospiraceae bacterium]
MKKTYLLILLAISIIMTVSCSADINEADNTTTVNTATSVDFSTTAFPDPTTAFDTEASPVDNKNGSDQKDFFPSGGMGDSYGCESAKKLSDLVPDGMNLINNKKISTVSPVFVNNFPVTMEGYAFEYTDDIRNHIINEFIKLSKLMGYRVTAKDYKLNIDDSDGHTYLEAKLDGVEFYSHANGMVVRYPIDISKNAEEEIRSMLKTDKVLAAICAYLNITDPYIYRTAEYNLAGEGANVSFHITNNNDDVFKLAENMTFNSFSITNYTENALIETLQEEKTEAAGNYARISYDEALEKVLDEFDKMNTEQRGYFPAVFAEISGDDIKNKTLTEKDIAACALEFNTYVVNGWYVPCYKFFIDIGADKTIKGFTNYAVYYVPACDISGFNDDKVKAFREKQRQKRQEEENAAMGIYNETTLQEEVLNPLPGSQETAPYTSAHE